MEIEMKKLIIAVALLIVTSSAYEFKYKSRTLCSGSYECRQSEALERIAAALEWMAESYTVESAPGNSKMINGRSIKAVPTRVEDDEGLDACIEKCWHHLMNSEIKKCTKECIKEYK